MRPPDPAIVLCVALASVVARAEGPRAARPAPVIKIGARTWTDRHLIGLTKNQLQTSFSREVKGYSLQWIRRTLRLQGALLPHPHLATEKDRAKLEDALFAAIYANTLRTAIENLLGSEVCGAIVAEHGISLSEYIDMDVLRDAFAREVGALEFLYEHRAAPNEANTKLYEEMKRRFRYKEPFERWDKFRRLEPRLARFQWMHLQTWGKAKGQEEARIRGLIAHLLLRNACRPGGPFYQKARAEYGHARSVWHVVNVDDYKGDEARLQALLELLINDEGDLAIDGLTFTRQWLHGLHVHIAWTDSAQPGAGPHGIPTRPVVGRMLKLGPTRYQIAAYRARGDLAEPDAAKMRPFLEDLAYVLAQQRFLPPIELLTKDLGPGVSLRQLLVGLRHFTPVCVCGSVSAGGLIKRPYPAEEFEDHDAEIHTVAIRGAKLALTEDDEGARQLVGEILARCEKIKPRAPRRALLRVARLVCRQMKLQAQLEQVDAVIKTLKP